MGKYLVAIVLIPFLAFVFQVVQMMDVLKQPQAVLGDYKSCRYLDDYAPGPEDMTRYDFNTLIYASGDFGKMITVGLPEKMVPGKFWAIHNAGEKDFHTREIPVEGFPSEVRLQPHGIFILRQDGEEYLYASNHAYDKGGERIEAFRILKSENGHLRLQYHQSITFSNEYNAMINDVVFVSTKEFYFSQWLVYPHDIKGHKYDGLWYKARQFFLYVFGYRGTYLHHCGINEDSSANCKRLDVTDAIVNNGMTYDGKHLYVADSVYKTVNVFTIGTNGSVTLKQRVPVPAGLDNVEFDPFTNQVYVIGIEKLIQFFKLNLDLEKLDGGELDKTEKVGYWTGVYSIDTTQTPLVAKTELVVQDAIKGASGAYIIGENIFLGSFGDQSVSVCQK